MPCLRLFGPARVAAGTGADQVEGATVAEVLDGARRRYGAPFDAVLATSTVWVNGAARPAEFPVGPDDEVAVLPPVSGGAR
ncbi:MAG TPA: MoaD/ThiS family protein [Acidimicrobiales bacterium]|nr:MoaD/ThiS family protein [Acidimicrobiales bacterium]